MAEKENQIIESVIATIEEKKDEFKVLFGVPFNFYPQTIRRLEESLNKMYPFGRQVAPQLVLMIGVYLGETIKRNLNKKDVKITWIENESLLAESILSIESLEGEENFQLKPILRAHKFLNADRTDSMWAMYCMMQDVTKGRVPLTDKGDKKWKQAPRGYKYRATKVNPDEKIDW